MLKSRTFSADWRDVPVVWIPNQRFACFVLNVTHLVLPAGELWFCRVFNQALPYIDDAILAEQVKGFISQEGAHARSHRDVLTLYENMGWDFSVSKQRLGKVFGLYLGENMLGLIPVKGAAKRRWIRMRIGIVAAIEHVTCVLGNWILQNQTLHEAGANKEMLDLLKWHGAEEVEHRSVAHDLYCYLGGGNVSRMLWFVPVLFVVVLTWKRGTQVFIRQDKTTNTSYGFRAYLGASRAGFLPTVSYLVTSFLRYFRWQYHPSREASDQQAALVLNAMKKGRF
jgi:predicted metal-dependent hydrolase